MKMQNCEISICFGGERIKYYLRNPGVEGYFERFRCPKAAEAETVFVTDEIWERHKNVATPCVSDIYTEFYALIGVTSRALLRHGKCLFHGVAFLWHGLAWLITAPSGTGKTTQLRLWKKLYGNELELINGDKPIMECREDGSVWMYPSPWNGKENLYGTASGRLAGIIYLEQADHNEIERMDIRSSMLPIYQQFLYYGDYEDEIRAVGQMQNIVLQNIPIWKLCNLGDEASAVLMHDALQRYLEEPNEKN